MNKKETKKLSKSKQSLRDKAFKKDIDMDNRPYICQECGIRPRMAGYPICSKCYDIDTDYREDE